MSKQINNTEDEDEDEYTYKYNKSGRKKLEDIIHDVLANGTEEDLNQQDKTGKTLLHLACMNNLIDCVRLLLDDDRVNPNISDIYKMTPFHYATGFDNSFDIFMLFIECARVSIMERTNEGQTAFLLATNEWNITTAKMINVLLDDPRNDPNATDNHGYTCFHNICHRSDMVEKDIFLKFLDNPKIDIQTKNKLGDTPFMSACACGNSEVVKLLLDDPRIDPNIRNNKGETAFYQACQSQWSSSNNIIELLIKLLINDPRVDVNMPNNDGLTPFCNMCKNIKRQDINKTIDILLNCDRIDKKKPDNKNISPIMYILGDSVSVVKRAIKAFGEDDIMEILKN